MKKEELLKLINSLKIDKDKYYILSSSALVIRDIWDKANDLDISVTKEGFEQLKSNYNLIDKGNEWYQVNELVECHVDNYNPDNFENINGYNVENIFKYYNFIKESKREKDKQRIDIVKNYIAKNYQK